jgi:hypothetical protein
MENFGHQLDKVSNTTDCFEPGGMKGKKQLSQVTGLQIKIEEALAKLT